MRHRFLAAVLPLALVAAPLQAQFIPNGGSFGSLPQATFGGSGIPNNAVQRGRNVGNVILGLTATQRYSSPLVTNDGAEPTSPPQASTLRVERSGTLISLLAARVPAAISTPCSSITMPGPARRPLGSTTLTQRRSLRTPTQSPACQQARIRTPGTLEWGSSGAIRRWLASIRTRSRSTAIVRVQPTTWSTRSPFRLM